MHTHRRNSRRLHAATVLLSMIVLVLWAVGPAPPAQAQPAPTTLTFEYTGGTQNWTVPAGVTQAAFEVFGAQGGSTTGNFVVLGGLGGRATATLPVTPGSVVTIVVGGAGAKGNDVCAAPPAGGFNGGGAGGVGPDGACGGGGGGASDVRIGGTGLEHRVLIAGGGGAALGRVAACAPAQGGDGGGLVGDAGLAADLAPRCTGGAGGNQDGTSGSGQRGQGSPGAGGGGGGGGYWGGAGGGPVAGGGGGSGFGPAGVVFATGVQQGNGRVVITYTVLPPAPTVTSISPTSGPEGGGTPVTITGTGFNTMPGGTSVAFDTSAATGVGCSSTTQCTATSPAGTGTVQVTVTTVNGTSNGVPFTYVTPPPPPPPPPPATPTVTSISPNRGPTTGGTVVTIAGTGFSTTPGVTAVTFAGVPATSVSCASSTTCTASSPPGTGIVDVRVTVSGRTSPVSPASAFTYVPSPPPPPPVPLAQPMTLTVQVWRILPPLVSEAQIERTVVPVGRATVEARIGATLCSQGVTDSQGRVQLVVAADPSAQGCGQAGARVTFRVNDVVVLGEVRFVPGGSTEVVLRLPSPIYVIP